MNQTIQIFFYSLIALFFILNWFALKQIKVEVLNPKLRALVIGIFIVCAILLLRVLMAPDDIWSKGFLLGLSNFGLAFILRRTDWPAYAIQVFLLFLNVYNTSSLNHNLPPSILCLSLLGLLIYRLLESFCFSQDNNLEDIFPSCVWLAALAWANVIGQNEANIQNIVLACLSVSLIVKLLPANILADDKFFIKRVILSICAGLVLLVILNTVLLQPNAFLMAKLFVLGILVSYLFKQDFVDDQFSGLIKAVTFLTVIGLCTLIATRLIGDIGTIILAAACCASVGKGIFAALFWSSRLLIQGFVLGNVANVTGINLMHPYCSAALYFGFLTIVFISIILRSSEKQWQTLAILLTIGLFIPPAILYLIHEEPGASFLIAANVVAISLISFAKLIYKESNDTQNNLILMPIILSAASLICAPLIEIGNHSTVAGRVQIISYAIAILIVIYFIVSNITKRTRNSV